ncbi:MAG: ASPIC/UnbV domain-containing protein, partial [Bacteroidota bacterium]
NGDGTFEDATASAGLANTSTIAVAAGDVNGDGWVDIITGSQVYLNDGGTNHWLRVQLRGTSSTPDGIGARVEVTAGGQTQIREITGGDGMMSQSHGLEAHVGLATETTADVTVRWPSGQVTELTGIAADQLVTIVEGEGVNTPPAAFDLTSPSDGVGVAVAAPVELAWEAAADVGPVSYTVQLHRPDGSEKTYSTFSTAFDLPAGDIAAEGAYGWAVIASDGRTPRTSLSRRAFVVGGATATEPDIGRSTVQLIASPNPTRGQVKVRVQGEKGLGVLDLLDVRGRIVASVERMSHATSLDLRGLPPGLYVVRFRPERGRPVHAMLAYTP